MKNKILGLHLERYMSKMICCEKGVVTGISWEFTPPEMFGERASSGGTWPRIWCAA